jgi:4-hydroxy-tetrahydrodipicolinate synthase
VKYALARLGRCAAEIRLPLVEPGEPSRPVIDAALVSAGLMN